MKKFPQDLTERAKAMKEGFIHLFTFVNGLLYCELYPDKGYSFKDCSAVPRACSINQEMVYLLTSPDGAKGFVVGQYNDQNGD